MDEGGCYQDTSAEMSREEEELVRDWDLWKSSGGNGKAASCFG
jgi:hypothetical protein